MGRLGRVSGPNQNSVFNQGQMSMSSSRINMSQGQAQGHYQRTEVSHSHTNLSSTNGQSHSVSQTHAQGSSQSLSQSRRTPPTNLVSPLPPPSLKDSLSPTGSTTSINTTIANMTLPSPGPTVRQRISNWMKSADGTPKPVGPMLGLQRPPYAQNQ